MTTVTIDQASVGDAQVILDLQRRAYRSEAEIYGDYTIPPLTQTLAEIEADFGSHVFLRASQHGQIVGSVRARLAGDTCHIGRLIVDPPFQNRGIGTALLREIEHSFPGASRFELFTGERSERNLRLYQREGYTPLRREALSEATTVVFLEKRPAGPIQNGVPVPAGEGFRRWLRRGGLAIGSIAAAFWLLIGLLAVVGGEEPWTAESSVLAVLIVLSALGAGISYRRQSLGGGLLALFGAAHCAFAYVVAGKNKGLAVAVSGLPFLVAGALLLLGSWRAAGGKRHL